MLWGLSNLLGGEVNHISHVFKNEDLVLRVIQLINSDVYMIQAEALWAVMNGVTKSSNETLLSFAQQFFDVLVEPLANSLNQIDCNDKGLLANLLEGIFKLLSLDFVQRSNC